MTINFVAASVFYIYSNKTVHLLLLKYIKIEIYVVFCFSFRKINSAPPLLLLQGAVRGAALLLSLLCADRLPFPKELGGVLFSLLCCAVPLLFLYFTHSLKHKCTCCKKSFYVFCYIYHTCIPICIMHEDRAFAIKRTNLVMCQSFRYFGANVASIFVLSLQHKNDAQLYSIGFKLL